MSSSFILPLVFFFVLHIPLPPPLELKSCYFDGFDARVQEQREADRLRHEKQHRNTPGGGPPFKPVGSSLLNPVYEGLAEARAAFKHRHIYSQICAREVQGLCILRWLREELDSPVKPGQVVRKELWGLLPQRVVGVNVSAQTNARALEDRQLSLPVVLLDVAGAKGAAKEIQPRSEQEEVGFQWRSCQCRCSWRYLLLASVSVVV